MANRTEKRTQIYLTAEQHRDAMGLARRRGDSLAGVVREALAVYLAAADRGEEADWDRDPAYRLALGGGVAVPPRPAGEPLPESIDRVVYDREGETWSSPTAPASSPRSSRARRSTAARSTPGGRSRRGGSGS